MPVITHTDGNVTQLEGCKMVRFFVAWNRNVDAARVSRSPVVSLTGAGKN